MNPDGDLLAQYVNADDYVDDDTPPDQRRRGVGELPEMNVASDEAELILRDFSRYRDANAADRDEMVVSMLRQLRQVRARRDGDGEADAAFEIEDLFRDSVYKLFEVIWMTLNDAHPAQLLGTIPQLTDTWTLAARVVKEDWQRELVTSLLTLTRAAVHVIEAMKQLAAQAVVIDAQFIEHIADEKGLCRSEEQQREFAHKLRELDDSPERVDALRQFKSRAADFYQHGERVVQSVARDSNTDNERVSALIYRHILSVLLQGAHTFSAAISIGSIEFYTTQLGIIQNDDNGGGGDDDVATPEERAQRRERRSVSRLKIQQQISDLERTAAIHERHARRERSRDVSYMQRLGRRVAE